MKLHNYGVSFGTMCAIFKYSELDARIFTERFYKKYPKLQAWHTKINKELKP